MGIRERQCDDGDASLDGFHHRPQAAVNLGANRNQSVVASTLRMKSAAHQDHPHGFTLEHLDLRCPTPRSSPSTLLHLFFNSGSTLEAVAHTKGISGEALRRKEMMVVMSEVRTVDQKFVPKLYKL